MMAGAAGQPTRAILHVDMDAFYASVEVLDDPSLCGKPVIVGGTPEGRGVVCAASYEARRYGVHSAMSAARAVKLCPDGVFLRTRMDRYAEISARIFTVFGDFTPLVEPLSVDEAFLDVTGCRRLFGPAPRIGQAIKDRIAQEVGLTASVGVAPNKFLAKLASDLEKPDGFVVVTQEGAPGLLIRLPVQRLWGVGKVMQRELNSLGVHTVGDLLATPRRDLVRRFGDGMERLLELAVGKDERRVIPGSQAKSVGNETTFAEDIADQWQLEGVLDHLTEKVARRLRSQGFLARTLTLKYRFADFSTHTRSLTLDEATDSSTILRETARSLLRDHSGRRGRPLRLVGITASGLSGTGAVQAELFADPAGRRNRDMDRILDRVHERFGPKLQRGARRPKRGERDPGSS